MKKSVFILITFLFATLFAQAVDPIYITLNGVVTHPNQEFSGLAWSGDNLILLPQYPEDVIYSIPKNEIMQFLDSKKSTITPNEIPWNTNCIEKEIKGFEGFESITFDGNHVYATIEAEHGNQNCGYLVKGTLNKCGIKFDDSSLEKIQTPVTLRNMTFETILLTDESVISIYEVNAKNVNENPFYYEFDRNLDTHSTKPAPQGLSPVRHASPVPHPSSTSPSQSSSSSSHASFATGRTAPTQAPHTPSVHISSP